MFAAAMLFLVEDASTWEYLKKAYDKDGDGRIARAEYTRDDEHFRRLDADGDGAITPADFTPGAARRIEGRRGGSRREGGRPAKVGETAPDFSLEELRAAPADKRPPPKPSPPAAGAPAPKPEPVTLSAFRGKRPVALVFGSYT